MNEQQRVRLRMFVFVSFTLFGGLVARLWYLQGVESQREQFQFKAETNFLEQVHEEAPRGRILDRNGRVLVDNEVVQVVTVDRGIVRGLDAAKRSDLFLRLAIAVSRSGRLVKVESIVDEFADLSYGPFERIPIAVDVNPELLVFIGERTDQFPGVEVVQRTVRSYPYGPLAAHLLGYVGPITRAEWERANAQIDPEDDEAKLYQLNHEIGKTGVERVFEGELRGVPGVRFLEVNAAGKVVNERDLLYVAPVPGNDVWLTIDIDLQSLTEKELRAGLDAARARPARDGEAPNVASAGAVVAVDPRDGDLLAMASFPTYEPTDFIDGISVTLFNELTSKDNFSPILNRAIQGTYAPGSTFKLVSALAALQEGVIGPDGIRDVNEIYHDTGEYVYSGCFEESSTCKFRSPFTDSRWVALSGALAVSSDTYFYEIGGEGFWMRSGADEDGLLLDEGIQKWARQLGLGADSGIQLPYERSGAVPDRAYYDAQFEDGVFAIDGSQWFGGATINLSIGQGELLVSPLQLANAYATFGNGGQLHQPNVASKITDSQGEVLTEFGPRVLRDLELTAAVHEPIETGLLGVTTYGTAAAPFSGFDLVGWPVAGKTGTAEVNGKADTSVFAAYGPARGLLDAANVEIAVGVILEESGFGSGAAAPVVRRILDHYSSNTVPVARATDEVGAR